MLQQRAEQRRRDEDDIAEMRRLLAEFGGQEVDDEVMETFSRGLAEETGALPPPHIVVEAIKESQSAEPRKIGDAVRALLSPTATAASAAAAQQRAASRRSSRNPSSPPVPLPPA